MQSPGPEWHQVPNPDGGPLRGLQQSDLGILQRQRLYEEFLIPNAQTSVKLAHQDLVAMNIMGGAATRFPHSTCKDLGNASITIQT